ncbi:aspartate--tRNA ligase [Patescibacteria group bacterium]|nr:aspartate--tRNA ligase [Patescibacteria group bacterium]MBU1663755.1 aspartate--tRNA ligase [Patescibacteria group bacterium]MBU1907493.1 aspartate--tRNA ligase [Patescibacteria group bacterium]
MNRSLNTETTKQIGKEVRINGWVHARRNMGKIVFLDMRDMSSLIQVVVVPGELDEASKGIVDEIRPEFVLEITGVVQERGEKQKNPDLATGNVEILAKTIQIQGRSETPPFEIDKDSMSVNEDLRLKYRYLDLRTERMTKNIRNRDKVVKWFRNYLGDHGFVEIETPLLTVSSPEGARDYIVPSRLNLGKFYALPQAPQQYKQLLMVAGYERYFQMARCMRDEDTRGDRQPEFTQFDMEMSFMSQEDILQLTEEMFTKMVRELYPEKKIKTPWPRLSYAEAMKKYGSDKPDLREDKEDPNELAFAWIVDFPLFTKNKETGQIEPMHHMFTMPNEADLDKLDSAPLEIGGQLFDMVCNGYELSSGSIRINDSELQTKILNLIGIEGEEMKTKFGHMLEAFKYGAPPHGGIAPGIDRLMMILENEPSIREVMAFPKNSEGIEPMTGAPAELSAEQLSEVHIEVKKSK